MLVQPKRFWFEKPTVFGLSAFATVSEHNKYLSIMDVCSSVMRYIVSRIVSNYYLKDIMYSCQILWAFLSRIWLRFDITVLRFFFKHIFCCVIS